MAPVNKIPSSILIVGSGVFGLSTAYSLVQHPDYEHTTITVLDQAQFPNPDGSSIDSSRIVRADYANIAYAQLALEAQEKWRSTWWGEDVYHEDGLVIAIKRPETSPASIHANTTGHEYMKRSLDNVRRLGLKEGPGLDVEVLPDAAAVAALFAHSTDDPANPVTFDADMGYVNRRSGWVDATAAMAKLRAKLAATARVTFTTGTATRLLLSPTNTVTGIRLSSGAALSAAQTILVTGAWSPALLDLRRAASATGQAVAYLALTPAEQARYARNPTILNESTGLFVITPAAGILKVARHGHGYANPTPVPAPCRASDERISVSLPCPCAVLPSEARDALRAFLRQTYPALAERAFVRERVCWYTDTPRGDWIVAHHPRFEGLFVATGGSGHAFKFAPVLGDVVLTRLRGEEVQWGLGDLWEWPTPGAGDKGGEVVQEGNVDEPIDGTLDGDWTKGQVWTEDWRGGRKWMTLREEMDRCVGNGNDP